MTCEYDRLFSSVVSALQTATDKGIPPEGFALTIPLIGMTIAPLSPEAVPFLFSTANMERRLQEIATLSPDPDKPLTWFAQVNGPNFPIRGNPKNLAHWGKEMLSAQRAVRAAAPFEPDTLAQNPMFVWGAAVMDGFFTDEELPAAVRCIEERFGRLPSHTRAGVFLEQITAVADLLACALKESGVERLVRLCGLLGFMFEVHNRKGEVVASSMRFAR